MVTRFLKPFIPESTTWRDEIEVSIRKRTKDTKCEKLTSFKIEIPSTVMPRAVTERLSL